MRGELAQALASLEETRQELAAGLAKLAEGQATLAEELAAVKAALPVVQAEPVRPREAAVAPVEEEEMEPVGAEPPSAPSDELAVGVRWMPSCAFESHTTRHAPRPNRSAQTYFKGVFYFLFGMSWKGLFVDRQAVVAMLKSRRFNFPRPDAHAVATLVTSMMECVATQPHRGRVAHAASGSVRRHVSPAPPTEQVGEGASQFLPHASEGPCEVHAPRRALSGRLADPCPTPSRGDEGPRQLGGRRRGELGADPRERARRPRDPSRPPRWRR
jgi:hypothetical protein